MNGGPPRATGRPLTGMAPMYLLTTASTWLLFSKAILRTEFETDRPSREGGAIKRKRLAAKRASKEK
jgi:hypothetical protein